MKNKIKRNKHLGWYGRLSNRIVNEINEDLFRYFNWGGSYIPGEILAQLYEQKYGIGHHGYDPEKMYEIHIGRSPKGIYVLVTDVKEINELVNQTK